MIGSGALMTLIGIIGYFLTREFDAKQGGR